MELAGWGRHLMVTSKSYGVDKETLAFVLSDWTFARGEAAIILFCFDCSM